MLLILFLNNISAEILGKTVIIFFVKISCIKSRLAMLISNITKTVLSKVFSDKLKIILIGDKIFLWTITQKFGNKNYGRYILLNYN